MNRNITALILIALSVGIYFTFTKDQLVQARAVKAVNDEYARAIDSAKELINVRDRVLADYNQISAEDQDKLDKMIPGSVDNIRLLIDLNSMARNHGIALSDLEAKVSKQAQSPGPGQVQLSDPSTMNKLVDPTLDEITVTFKAEAPYLQFIQFLQAVESNLRIMDISNLSLTATESGYEYEVELKTYWLRQ